jgi:hypothetical protein
MSEINQIPLISTLHQEKHMKESSKHDIFNIVLNKIIQKIIYTNRHTDQTYVIFEIPQILIGYPQYDMKSCLLFVMNKLSNNGYIVEFMQPFYVYIDWGSSINSNKTNVCSSKMPSSISGKHKDKLRAQTRALLNQFPNTSQIEFVYEDKAANKNNDKATNKNNDKNKKSNKENDKQQKRLKKNKKK